MESVGVVIPAFNAARTIGRALSSVFAQDRTPECVVVVDDGSQDNTCAVVAQRFPSVRLVSQENGGPSRARNAGAALLDTDWIAFLDADDVWFHDKIATQLALAAQEPRVALVAAGWTRSLTRREIAAHRVPARDLPQLALLFGYFLGPSGVMVRREAFERAGGFRPAMDGIEDRDLFARLAMSGRALLADGVLWHYAPTPGSFSKRRMRGFLAGLALMAESRSDVERRFGREAWEIVLGGSLLRYRLYFRRDGDAEGVAKCDEELSHLSGEARSWAYWHLFLPQVRCRLAAKVSRHDTYRNEYLPSERDLTGPVRRAPVRPSPTPMR